MNILSTQLKLVTKNRIDTFLESFKGLNNSSCMYFEATTEWLLSLFIAADEIFLPCRKFVHFLISTCSFPEILIKAVEPNSQIVYPGFEDEQDWILI